MSLTGRFLQYKKARNLSFFFFIKKKGCLLLLLFSCQQLDKGKENTTTRPRADTLPNGNGIFNNSSYYTWLGQQPEATRFHQSNTAIDARLQAQTPKQRLRAFSMLDSAYSCKEEKQQKQVKKQKKNEDNGLVIIVN
jgi:hypothetical protein